MLSRVPDEPLEIYMNKVGAAVAELMDGVHCAVSTGWRSRRLVAVPESCNGIRQETDHRYDEAAGGCFT